MQEPSIILTGLEVETHFQLLCGGYLTLYASIVEGVAVCQRQPPVIQRNGRINGRIDVPGSKHGKAIVSNGFTVWYKLLPVGMTMCLCLHRYRDMGHPHVFLIHGVGYP